MSYKNMKEELTCPICMELFRQPRRLPCGHSYCHFCLRAMLDRSTETSILNATYERSLVCPECRDKVIVDSHSGVEVIPPDFKLSKLVDLFKFMKKNDSDSSGDELPSSKPASCPVKETLTLFSESEAASLPGRSLATALHTDPSSALVSHQPAPVTQSTQQLEVYAGTSAALVNPEILSSSSQSARESLSIPSDQQQILSSSSDLPHVQQSIIQPAVTNTSSSAVANNPNSPSVNDLNAVSPPGITSSVERSLTELADVCHQSESTIAEFSAQTGINNNESRSVGQEPFSDGSIYVNKSRSLGQEPLSNRSIYVNESRSVGQGQNGDDQYNSYSGFGATGGISISEESTNRLASTQVQYVDPLEIVSEWVNENHCYSQNNHHLSHSSVSLPAEVGEEIQYPHELPEIDTQFQNPERALRAHSVPTETECWNKSVAGGGQPVEHAASKRHNIKARKVKRGVFSRFVESDTSSDSSEDERRQQRSAEKPKRWLMTRFLRSVILSESSSSMDDSDDSNYISDTVNSTRCRDHQSQENSVNITSTQGQYLPVDNNLNCKSGLNSARNIHQTENSKSIHTSRTPAKKCTDTTSENKSLNHPSDQSKQKNNSVMRIHNLNYEACGSASIESNTLPKQPASDSSPSIVSETSRKIYSNEPSIAKQNGGPPMSSDTSSSPNLPTSQNIGPANQIGGKYSSRVRQRAHTSINQEQASPNSLHVGSPPTFYDNVGFDSVEPRFPRCYQHEVAAFPSGLDQGRTFYDNLDIRQMSSVQAQPGQTLVNNLAKNPTLEIESLKTGHENNTIVNRYHENAEREHRSEDRNNVEGNGNRSTGGRPVISPVTEIEDLKTGTVHTGSSGNDKNIGISAGKENKELVLRRDNDRKEHLKEIDHTRCHSLPSQDINPRHDLNNEASPSSNTSENAQASHLHTHHVTVTSGNHPSLYDNIDNSLSPRQPTEVGAGLSSQANSSEDNNLGMVESQITSCNEDPYQNTQHVTDFPGRSEEDMQLADNYFDQYSQHYKCGASPVKNIVPSCVNARDKNVSDRRTRDSGFAVKKSSAAVVEDVGSALKNTEDVAGASQRNVGNEAGDDEDACHSGTSMLQNKKKPRSRLKKFLTSLLSLSSSSSEDDENYRRNTSSESSDW